MTKNLLLLTCAAGALGLMADVGHAATATANDAATDQAGASVTELVVTAERRETSLQKVPVAVSVFTGSQRDAIGINTVADVTNFAPGFTYDPANVHAYIRGVGRQSVNVTDDQRVANYEDEFYVYSPFGLGKSSLFLSQEQIERGPQNVGGRMASGGSIDMISVRPTDHPYAEVRAEVANFGTYNIEGAVSGQVAPGLDLRLAASDKNQNEGYFNNLLGGKSEGGARHEYYIEGQADWKPNDKFELWSRAFTSAWDNRAGPGSRQGFANGSWDQTNLTDANSYIGGGLFVNPNYGYSAPNGNPSAFSFVSAHPGGDIPVTSVTLYNKNVLNNPGMTNPYNFASPVQTDVRIKNYDDFNYVATYHAKTFDIKYTGGIQGYDYGLDDTDGVDTGVKSYTLASFAATPLTIFPQITGHYEEDDWWTAHDITFESTTDDPLQWTAGAFFYYQHYDVPYTVSAPQQSQFASPICGADIAALGTGSPIGCGAGVGQNPFAAALLGSAPNAPSNPGNALFYDDYAFNVTTLSGYGQLAYKINDQFRVTGNIRYSWDDKSGAETTRYVALNSGIIDGFEPFLGAATPAVDVTASQICPTGNSSNILGGSCLTGPLVAGVKSAAVIQSNGFAQRQLGASAGAVTGGAKLEWTPTPDIFTYASYGRGYASPTFNAGTVGANPMVKQEFINSWEVGYKQSFGRNLLVDLAAFYYDYDGLQLPITITTGGVTLSQFVNVPKARSDGIEAEVYWTPVRDLMITGSYSFNDTAILTGCNGAVGAGGTFEPGANALCLIDTNDPMAVAKGAHPIGSAGVGANYQSVKGNALPNAPQNKIAISAAYTWHYDPGDLTLSASYVWRDKQDGSVFDRWYDNAPSWSDVDIRALWKSPGDRYEVIGYVKNVFNTLQYNVGSAGVGLLGNSFATASYLNGGSGGLLQQNLYQLNPPRTYGMEVRYKFF